MQYSHLGTHAGDYTAFTEARYGVGIITSQRTAPSGRNRPAAFSPWQPMSVTLLSEPGEDGYANAESVPARSGGGAHRVQKPFEVTIDACTVPEFRETAGLRSEPVDGGGARVVAFAACYQLRWTWTRGRWRARSSGPGESGSPG